MSWRKSFGKGRYLRSTAVDEFHLNEAMEMGYRHGRLHHRSRSAEDSPKPLSEHAARASSLILPCRGSRKSRSTPGVHVAGPCHCCVPGLAWVADGFLQS